MTIGFILEDNEKKVTPMKVATALVETEQFSRDELKELIAYLSVYTRYNQEK